MPDQNDSHTSQNPDLTHSLLESLQDQIQRGQEAGADASIEDQLVQARASRTQAEVARQQIANEILEATKAVCQKLITDGEETLDRAKRYEAEATRSLAQAQKELERSDIYRAETETYAEKIRTEAETWADKLRADTESWAQKLHTDTETWAEKHQSDAQLQAQTRLEEAQRIRTEADAYRDRVVSEADQQGQEMLRQARATAQDESDDIRQGASFDSQKMLAEAELIKAAAREEMEAQKIYAEAARLEAESREVLAQVRAKLEGKIAQDTPTGYYAPVADLTHQGWPGLEQETGQIAGQTAGQTAWEATGETTGEITGETTGPTTEPATELTSEAPTMQQDTWEETAPKPSTRSAKSGRGSTSRKK